jgi:NAD(P)H-hydrate epimerase
MPPLSPWPARDAHHLLVTSAEMAALEQRLFDSGLPVEALMEKAALAVSARILAAPPEAVLVLVGPGHNGGDGLVVARELHLAGVAVRIWCPFERLRPLTASHRRHNHWLGIPELTAPPDPTDPCLWIDALFGIGQKRPPGEEIEVLLAEREQQRPGRLVAIDGPSGLCPDRGTVLGRVAARAVRTYCIGLIKSGLVQDSALRWVGQLERIDLNLPAFLLETLPRTTPLALAPADRAGAPWPQPDPASCKYGRGRLLLVAGSRRYLGAADLALRGAAASGCGYVRAALPRELEASLWSVHPEVVPESFLGASAGGGLALADLPDGWLDRLDAVLLGPGLGAPGRDCEPTELHRWEELQAFGGLLLLDADGLNRLAAGAAGMAARTWLQGRSGATWLTPHAGEFARVFPAWADSPPLKAASAAAAASGCALLLKGARSVIAAPDGRCWQVVAAAPEAARAGLGDVLAGYAAGRGALALAAGGGDDTAPLLAAAALDHASSGLHAAASHGPAGATPQAVADALRHRSADGPMGPRHIYEGFNTITPPEAKNSG